MMKKTEYGYIPDDFHVGTKEHPVCTFFELFVGTTNPYDNYYCLPLCHMVNDEKPAEICKGDYIECPLKIRSYTYREVNDDN